MVHISLTKRQLSELQNHYKEELEKAELRAIEIQDLLKQLKLDNENNLIPETETENRTDDVEASILEEAQLEPLTDIETPVAIKTAENEEVVDENENVEDVENQVENQEEDELETTPSIDISKLDWENFLKVTISSKNELLTASELVDLAISSYQLTAKEKRSISRKITPALGVLTKTGVLKKQRIEGIPTFYYGYSEWFNETDGTLLPEYEKTIEVIERPAKKVKQEPPVLTIEEEGLKTLILRSLDRKRELMNIEGIYGRVKRALKFPVKEKEVYTEKIQITLDKMFKTKAVKKIRKTNKDEYKYALPKWFKNSGVLRKRYLEMLDNK